MYYFSKYQIMPKELNIQLTYTILFFVWLFKKTILNARKYIVTGLLIKPVDRADKTKT